MVPHPLSLSLPLSFGTMIPAHEQSTLLRRRPRLGGLVSFGNRAPPFRSGGRRPSLGNSGAGGVRSRLLGGPSRADAASGLPSRPPPADPSIPGDRALRRAGLCLSLSLVGVERRAGRQRLFRTAGHSCAVLRILFDSGRVRGLVRPATRRIPRERPRLLLPRIRRILAAPV